MSGGNDQEAVDLAVSNYFCILFLIAVVVIMTQIPDMLISIIVLPIWVIFIYMTYLLEV